MRVRTLVSSAVVMAALFSTSSLVHGAVAGPMSIISPLSQWSVTRIDNGSGGYCAMARRYDPATVMTLAQNENEKMSFALDFGRPLFKTGQNISVILDPGAGQQRAYDVVPASNAAFVVRLGRDRALLNALDKTRLLRIEVGGQSYRFDMADLDTGRAQLGACAHEGGAAQPIADAAEPVAKENIAQTDVQAEKMAAYEEKIEALSRQVERLSQAEADKVSLQEDQEKIDLAKKVQEEKKANDILQRQLAELKRAQDKESQARKVSKAQEEVRRDVLAASPAPEKPVRKDEMDSKPVALAKPTIQKEALPERAQGGISVASMDDSFAEREALADLPEAQRQEMLLKKGIARAPVQEMTVQEQPVQKETAKMPSAKAVKPSVGAPDEGLSLHQSQDPFADMNVEEDTSVPATPVKPKAVAKAPDDRVALTPPVKSSVKPSVKPVMRPAISKEGAFFKPDFALSELLSRAQLEPVKDLRRVDKASGPKKVSYQWRGDGVYGMAEQGALSSVESFDDLVKVYLERTQKRCAGDFAVTLNDTVDKGQMRADTYDVACVGGKKSAAAALLFFNQGGTFTALSQETRMDSLDAAMEGRDRVLKALTGL